MRGRGLTTTSLTKTRFHVAVPIETGFQSDAVLSMQTMICTIGNNQCGGDNVTAVATSGIAIFPYEGGNTQDHLEEEVYRHVKKKSSLTVLAYALVIGAAFFVGGGLLTGNWGLAAPAAPGAGVSAGAVAPAVGATQLGATGLGLANAGVYALGSTIGSGSNLTSPQESFAGFIGFDPEDLTTGSAADPSGWSEHQRGVISANVDRHTANSILSNNALRSAKALAQGGCGVAYTAAQCAAAGLDAGMAPRADTYNSGDTYNTLRDKYAWCQSMGKTGDALRRCAAPIGNPSSAN